MVLKDARSMSVPPHSELSSPKEYVLAMRELILGKSIPVLQDLASDVKLLLLSYNDPWCWDCDAFIDIKAGLFRKCGNEGCLYYMHHLDPNCSNFRRRDNSCRMCNVCKVELCSVCVTSCNFSEAGVYCDADLCPACADKNNGCCPPCNKFLDTHPHHEYFIGPSY